MDLTLIVGPMKSGKSFDLISYFAPLKYTDIPFMLYQPLKNQRDSQIWSRNGVEMNAKKVHSLAEALESNFQVIGVDEFHMFEPAEVDVIEKLLRKGVKVVVSGLDTDYQGRMFEIIKRLLELGPKEVRHKRAVCEICKKPAAVHTQILSQGVPMTDNLPPVVPDDGTYEYKSVCRGCFVKK
jgi:thymidine kinase